MADSNNEHPYGTCEGCGCDLWEFGGRPGDHKCHTCEQVDRRPPKCWKCGSQKIYDMFKGEYCPRCNDWC